MNTALEEKLGNQYMSPSQIARRLTEGWTAANLYCPRCGSDHLIHETANRPVKDFSCPACGAVYEQKSRQNGFSKKTAGGAYEAMIDRIKSTTNPDFLFMNYSRADMRVHDLFAVPKFFFTPKIVEKREPLSPTAKRAGWTGCNILLHDIPEQGRIYIIENSVPLEKAVVIKKFAAALKLEVKEMATRSWLLDILNCVNKTAGEEFTLAKIYDFEEKLSAIHPENNNIRAKIRQQLQMLRDRGLIEFAGRGRYRKAAL
ncbi:MAG: DpnI domain-containing protein [Cloacibacillus sp.]